MSEELYPIEGDDGGLFCMCLHSGDEFILKGKNTSISLQSLVSKAASHNSRNRMKPPKSRSYSSRRRAESNF